MKTWNPKIIKLCSNKQVHYPIHTFAFSHTYIPVESTLTINPQYGLLRPTLIFTPIEPKQKLFTNIRKTYEKANKRRRKKHQMTK